MLFVSIVKNEAMHDFFSMGVNFCFSNSDLEKKVNEMATRSSCDAFRLGFGGDWKNEAVHVVLKSIGSCSVRIVLSHFCFLVRYNAVMQSWRLAFDWEQGVNFQIRDVRARVLTDMAWVTMKTYFEIDTKPFIVTNVFEFHNGRWYLVHHHSSDMNGEVEQPIVQGQ